MKLAILIIITNSLYLTCCAQVDTISITKNNLHPANLKEGTSLYACWTKDLQSGSISYKSILERRVSFKKMNGEDVIVVMQKNYKDSTSNKRIVLSRTTLKTIYSWAHPSGSGIAAFNYNDDEIKGADSVKDNTKANFNLKFNVIPYSFETDIETFCVLPIKHAGQKMAISFYQPGATAQPGFHALDVIGEEKVAVITGEKIDCWIIKLSLSGEDFDLIWVSKNHEFIKLESHSPTDVFYKERAFSL